MQGSVIESKEDKTVIRPMFAEERQELAVRSAVSAANSWLIPGTWGIGMGGAGLLLKLTFHGLVEMASAMYVSPSASFVNKFNGVLDVVLVAGGALILLAIWNVIPRK